mgnify:CR=1 FL=1
MSWRLGIAGAILALGLGAILIVLVLLANAGAYAIKEAAQRRFG